VTFARRLLLGTFTVVALTLLVLVWGSERALRNGLERDLHASLLREADLVRSALPADSLEWGRAVTRLGAESGHQLVLRDGSGRIRAATDSLPTQDMLAVRSPGGVLSIEVAAPLTGVKLTVARARSSMLRAALLALAVALALAFVAGRSIAAPLVLLAAAARAIAAGALPKFPRSGISEVDALAQALRQMHRQLAERFEELQAEQANGSAVVDAMMEGIIVADARGRIVTANPAARRLLGYGAGEGLPELRTLFRDKAAREAVEEVLAGRMVQDRELELDDQIVSLNARAVAGGGAILVLHDLTVVRRLESVRRDFVANVSHELKTPLTSIAGYTETLADGGVDPATTRRFLETIRSNAQRMHRLVDDLLDLSRIESGRWVPRPSLTPIASAIREAFAAADDRATTRQVTLALEVAPDAAEIYADPEALGQVLTNLIDNSLRYTPAGGTITCRTRRVDETIELAVIDTGTGIPGEHLGRIFERFYRVEPSRSREEGGTGLGLSIVRHLVESHGGTVAIESTLGAGTTIFARFPVVRGFVTTP
jgi:two-component system phosphate regulon sensor histidine kinase PhoR